jgi:hypothetical protein
MRADFELSCAARAPTVPLFLRVRHFERAALAPGEQGCEMDFVHCNRMHFLLACLSFS